MRIKKEFKRTGEFWLSSTPDTRIHGTLSISDGGLIELETIGFFADWKESLNIDLKRIVGYIQKDRSIPLIPVTLDNCTYKTIPTPVGIPKSSIRVSRAFTGVQYDEDEVPSFNTLTFSVEGIDDWIEISGVRVEYPSEKRSTTILYEPQEDVSLNLDNGMQLLITWCPSLKYLINKEAGIREKIYFKLISQEARELDEFTSIVRKITEFLCFAINQIVSLGSICATSDDLTQEIGDSKTVPVSKELKAAKDANLWILCLKMELLFELHILQLMGFSRERIDSIVDNSPELKRKCN